MSLAAMTWAFEQDLPPNEKIVLLALSDCENGHSLVCIPGQERIAEMASMSIRTVRTMLDKLEKRKLITRERRTNPDGSRTSDAYRLHRFTQPANLAGSTPEVDLPANLAGGPTGKSEGAYRQTVAGMEPEVKPEVVEEKPRARDDHRLFDVFWATYPLQTQHDAALQAWKQVRYRNPNCTEQILIAAQAYAVACADAVAADPDAAEYIPFPARWLESGQWQDATPRPPRGRRRKPPAPAKLARTSPAAKVDEALASLRARMNPTGDDHEITG